MLTIAVSVAAMLQKKIDYKFAACAYVPKPMNDK